MLIFDLREIGNRMLAIRKSMGKTQAEIAEAAEMSDRSYADIERGGTNMRLETLLKICRALGVTPDVVLTRGDGTMTEREEMLLQELNELSLKHKNTAFSLLSTYLQSVQ